MIGWIIVAGIAFYAVYYYYTEIEKQTKFKSFLYPSIATVFVIIICIVAVWSYFSDKNVFWSHKFEI